MHQPDFKTLFGPDALDRVVRPIESATGLPARAYTDAAAFDLEQRTLFRSSWVGVAFAEDIPGTGDALPVTLGGLPIALVRGEDGEVRGFHNVCRHRAILVVTEPCQGLRNLTCPYHAWAYGLDGALKATPYWDGSKNGSTGLDRADNGLVPVRAGVWNHVIYVNLDGNAEPLETYLQPALEAFAPLDLDAWQLAGRATWEFTANWKLVLENWENYHHVWVHNGVFTKMSEEVDLQTGRCFTESLPRDNVLVLRRVPDAPARAEGTQNAKWGLPSLPFRAGGDAGFRGQTTAVLPNTTLTMGPYVYTPVVYTPLAPNRTRGSMAFYFVGDAATAPEWTEARNRVIDRWIGPTRQYGDPSAVRSQDYRCMELQQAAHGSPVADIKRFSPVWEPNVHHFQSWVARRMSGTP